MVMRRVSFAVLSVACAQAKPTSHGYPSITASGRVVTQEGQPIANAEIAICDCDSGACEHLRHALVWDAQPPSIAWARLAEASERSQVTFARTDAEGRWTARTPWCGWQAKVHVWAEGRAVAAINGTNGTAPFRTTLSPAVTLEITLPCAAGSCAAGGVHIDPPVETGPGAVSPGDFTVPAGREHRFVFHALRAGTYQIHATRGDWQAGEEEGSVTFEAVAGETRRVEPEMTPTGTGKPLIGILQFDMHEIGPAGDRIEIEALCRDDRYPGSREHGRRGVIRAPGPFRLEDIPPGQCHVSFTVRGVGLEQTLCAERYEPGEGDVYVRSLKFCPPIVIEGTTPD
jgi:hypothetical protein